MKKLSEICNESSNILTFAELSNGTEVGVIDFKSHEVKKGIVDKAWVNRGTWKLTVKVDDEEYELSFVNKKDATTKSLMYYNDDIAICTKYENAKRILH